MPPRTDDAGSGSRTARCTISGGCPGPAERSAPDARFGPSRAPRRRTATSSRRAWRPSASARRRRPGPRIDGHVGCCWPGPTAINLTGIREPAAVALDHVVDSLAVVRCCGRTGSPRCWTSAAAAASGPHDRRRAARRPGPARRLRRQEGRLPAHVIEATGLGRTVAAEAVRAEALAHDDRDREAWPAVTSRAVAALAELVEVALPLVAPGGILVAWKRGAAGRGARGGGARAAGARRRPPGGGRRRRAGPGGTPPHRRRAGGSDRSTLSAGPGRAPTAPVVSRVPERSRRHRCATLARCASPSSRTSMPTSRPSKRCWRRSARSTRSGSWATSSATGPSPTRWSPGCARSGRVGVRGNHDAAAVGRLDIDAFNVDARRAMEWTQATIAAGPREWLEALPERLEREDSCSSTAAPATRPGST